MTPAEIDAARQLAAHPSWRWSPGMCPKHKDGHAYPYGTHIPSTEQAWELDGNLWWYPDISDAATRGQLLQWVRVRRHCTVYVEASYQAETGVMRWLAVSRGEALAMHWSTTEGLALAAAWLEAP